MNTLQISEDYATHKYNIHSNSPAWSCSVPGQWTHFLQLQNRQGLGNVQRRMHSCLFGYSLPIHCTPSHPRNISTSKSIPKLHQSTLKSNQSLQIQTERERVSDWPSSNSFWLWKQILKAQLVANPIWPECFKDQNFFQFHKTKPWHCMPQKKGTNSDLLDFKICLCYRKKLSNGSKNLESDHR
jgi:hypothetical protein